MPAADWPRRPQERSLDALWPMRREECFARNWRGLALFASRAWCRDSFAEGKLLETQEQARRELAELEARLAALHLPLQERSALMKSPLPTEKQLKTRDDEMRNITPRHTAARAGTAGKAKEETTPAGFN